MDPDAALRDKPAGASLRALHELFAPLADFFQIAGRENGFDPAEQLALGRPLA